ncbi:hypothetical protein ZWY2020_022151 [Hordeum vulgare]|nr:hypothetical protein ZWY2020_022151 [Hordeum vulgare]
MGWLEYIVLFVDSGSIAAACLPPSLRAALEEYTDVVREVGAQVLQLMAYGLNMAEENRGVLWRMATMIPSSSMLGTPSRQGGGDTLDEELGELLREALQLGHTLVR